MAALALCACTNRNTDSEAAHRSISFEHLDGAAVYTLEGSAADTGEETDWRIGMRVNLLVPTMMYGDSVRTLRDSISSLAFGIVMKGDTVPEQFFQNTASQFGYEAVEDQVPDSVIHTLLQRESALADYDASASVSGSVGSLTDALMGYQLICSVYPPHAAHGMYSTYGINYDMTSHRIVSLADLFTPEGLDALPAIIAQKASRMTRTIGRTNISALPYGNNFLINTQNEIVMIYQPMEVASFAQGTIEITLEPYDLSEYLTPYGQDLLLNR